jgi:hypothetical protein
MISLHNQQRFYDTSALTIASLFCLASGQRNGKITITNGENINCVATHGITMGAKEAYAKPHLTWDAKSEFFFFFTLSVLL